VAGNDLLQNRRTDLSAANACGNDIIAIAAGAGNKKIFYQLLEDVSCLSLCTAGMQASWVICSPCVSQGAR